MKKLWIHLYVWFLCKQVLPEDELYPKLICTECADQVYRCYIFKEQCEANQQLLEKLKSGLNDIDYFDSAPASPILKQILTNTSPESCQPEEIQDYDYFNETEINFNCKQCGKTFSRKDYLKKHLKRHATKNIIKQKTNCPICSKAVINVKFHMKMNHAEHKPFKCEECEESFPLNCVLERHIRFHHRGEKRKKIERLCTLCGKTVYSSTALVYHMRVHAGVHPFMCDICSKRFNSAEHLKVHKRTHTGEKPYSCVVCNKCFVTSNVLKKHMRTHTGERPYVCQICNKAFTQSGVLKTHMKIHSQ